MAVLGSGGEAAWPWMMTSTWPPACGEAVEDAVSFETSDMDIETSPVGVVLTQPGQPASDEDGTRHLARSMVSPHLVLAW
jgi:hypothetical protein